MNLTPLITEGTASGLEESGCPDLPHMSFFGSKSTHETAHDALIETGRHLLATVDLKQSQGIRAYGLATVIKICCSGNGRSTAEVFAHALRGALEAGDVHFDKVREVVKALFEAQPHTMLDVFVLSPSDEPAMWRFDMGGRKGLPYKLMGSAALRSWASIDPETRYALLGPAMSLFSRGDFEESSEIDSLFADLLGLAPDKTAFLGRFASQVYPNQVGSSLKAALEHRKAQLVNLARDMPGEVADWVHRGLPDLDRWIGGASVMERDQEESFE